MTQPNAELMWNMTRKCNFSCQYCYYPHDHTPVDTVLDVHELLRVLNDTEYTWNITLTGGEPFLYPDFIDICCRLTEKHYIEVDTNLSISPAIRAFANTITPERVKLLYVSLHIEEREKRGGVESFVSNVRMLQEKGFHFKVNYVVHPNVLGRFAQDQKYFNSLGISLVPRPFKGEFEMRRYPEAYGESARNIFSGQAKAGAKTVFNFKGVLCDGGMRFVRLEPDGTFFRCSGDKRMLGKLGESVRFNTKPEPCGVNCCPCRGLAHVHLTPAQQHFVKGISYANIWETDKAKREFEKTLNKEPEHAGALNNMGGLAWREGDREKAAGFFAQALRVRPGSVLYQRNKQLAAENGDGDFQLCNKVIP